MHTHKHTHIHARQCLTNRYALTHKHAHTHTHTLTTASFEIKKEACEKNKLINRISIPGYDPRSFAGLPFDSVGILRTTSYCAPLRVPAVIGVLAVSRHDKPKIKKPNIVQKLLNESDEMQN